MREGWRMRRLSDVANVSWGDTTKTKASYTEEGYPAFSASGLDGFMPHYDHEGDGVVLSAIGARCGMTWFTRGKWSCIKNTIYFQSNTPEADTGFLYWATKDPVVWPKRGAAQPFISQTDARHVEIALPPLPVQRAIAGVLAAYDELIENNTRRIKLLEQMAQALYREWFVRPCQAGKLPKGWETKKLGEVADINALTIRRGQEPAEIDYIDISSVIPGRVEKVDHYDFSDAPGRARRIVNHGDVIWSCVRPNRRSYALILNPQLNLIVSTGFAVITGKSAPYTYLYHALTTDAFVGYLTNHARGAAYPAVTGEDFENAKIALPPATLLDRFNAITAPQFDLIHNLHLKNANLRRTRDLLLPKLISGEVSL